MTSDIKKFTSLAIEQAEDLIFGKCEHPVKCGNNLVIGNGYVFPEINFTLPAMTVNESSWPAVLRHYREIADNLSTRAIALDLPGLVLEFEQLPPMTENPDWGAEITFLLSSL